MSMIEIKTKLTNEEAKKLHDKVAKELGAAVARVMMKYTEDSYFVVAIVFAESMARAAAHMTTEDQSVAAVSERIAFFTELQAYQDELYGKESYRHMTECCGLQPRRAMETAELAAYEQAQDLARERMRERMRDSVQDSAQERERERKPSENN
jgi:nicotinamide mononucleotide adenylyltransferase